MKISERTAGPFTMEQIKMFVCNEVTNRPPRKKLDICLVFTFKDSLMILKSFLLLLRRRRYRIGRVISRFIAKDVRRDVEVTSNYAGEP